MGQLPVVSGQQARQAFERLGWAFKRQRGSHMILYKRGTRYSLSVPDHKELRPGTLAGLLRQAEVSVDDFRRALGLD